MTPSILELMAPRTETMGVASAKRTRSRLVYMSMIIAQPGVPVGPPAAGDRTPPVCGKWGYALVASRSRADAAADPAPDRNWPAAPRLGAAAPRKARSR